MFSAVLESDYISIINYVDRNKSWPTKVSCNMIEENFGRGKVVGVKDGEIVVCEKGKISVKDIFLNIYEKDYFGKNDSRQLIINKNEVYVFSTVQDYKECLIIGLRKTDGEIVRTTSVCIPRIELEKKFKLDYCGKIEFVNFGNINDAYLDFGCFGISVELFLKEYFPERILDKKKIERENIINKVIPTIPDVAKISLEKFDEIIAWEYDRVLVYITVHGEVFAVENPERFVEHPYFEKDDYLISQLIAMERKNRVGKIYLQRKRSGNKISIISSTGNFVHNLDITESLYTIEKDDFITYIFDGKPYTVLRNAKFSF